MIAVDGLNFLNWVIHQNNVGSLCVVRITKALDLRRQCPIFVSAAPVALELRHSTSARQLSNPVCDSVSTEAALVEGSKHRRSVDFWKDGTNASWKRSAIGDRSGFRQSQIRRRALRLICLVPEPSTGHWPISQSPGIFCSGSSL